MKKIFQVDGTSVSTKLRNHDEGYKKKDHGHTGHCFKVSESLVGFFKYKERLFCFVDDITGPKESFRFQNKTKDENRIFTVELNGEQILKSEYKREKDYDGNPFWPTDEEDVDPKLWSSLILNSPERTSIILETTNESLAQQGSSHNVGKRSPLS